MTGSPSPGSTRSPGLCQRLAITPANGARTVARSARAVAAVRALSACASAAVGFAQLALCVLGFLASGDATLDESVESCGRCAGVFDVRCRLIDGSLARGRGSAASDGMSKRTSISPAATRSPSPFGSAAMRAASGAVTVSSAPGAAATRPVAEISSRMLPTVTGSTFTTTAVSVTASSGAAS